MLISCWIESRPNKSLPTLNFKLPTLIRPRITRDRDDNDRPVPLGRQRPPVVRHIHAKDLKIAPIPNPEPKDEPKQDTKPNNAKSTKSPAQAEKPKEKSNEKVKKEKASLNGDVKSAKDADDSKDEESWMDRNTSQGNKSVAPVTVVAHPKSADRDYLNPRTSKTPKSKASGMFSPKSVSPSPSVTISQGAPDTIRVTPSPLSWDNTGEKDDVSLPESLRAITPSQDLEDM